MSMVNRGLEVVTQLEGHGFEAYLVGGCVRDLVLNRPCHDVDICTSARPEEVQQLFEQTIPTGLKHGTITVLWQDIPFEVTTFRAEGKYLNHRQPEEIKFLTSLEEDLSRRDFTCNALALTSSREIIDLFDGQGDMKSKMIRTVGLAKERFTEDALRMLRAIRFSAQLDFLISEELLQSIKESAQLLTHISRERLTSEWSKVMGAPYVHRGMSYLVEGGLTEHVLPFSYLKGALEELVALSPSGKQAFEELQTVERWLLLLLLTKSKEKMDKTLMYLTLRRSFRKQIAKLMKHYEKLAAVRSYRELPLVELLQIGANDLKHLVRVHQLLHVDKISVEEVAGVDLFFEKLPIQEVHQLQLSGAEMSLLLNKKPGPWIETAIFKLAEAVLKGKINNQKQELRDYLLKEVDQ